MSYYNEPAVAGANGNISANGFIPGFATTPTAAGTTTLDVASKEIQEFTGVTTQTVKLPVVSTLVRGQQFWVINNSTGIVTVNSSGNNAVQLLQPGTSCLFTCVLVTGTDAASWDAAYIPGQPGSANVGYLNIPQNSQSAAYQLVLADSGKHIYHPVGDTNNRQFTIPANSGGGSPVAFPLGTAVTFINDSPNDVTVVITSDVLVYADVGVITTLTIPQYNQATIIKVLTTQWNASGTAGCTTA